MDEKLKVFNYKKADGSISRRELYIVHENSEYYTGFDFKYLNDAERNLVKKVFDSKPISLPPTPGTTKVDYAKLGINQAIFKKSYRTFLKQNII